MTQRGPQSSIRSHLPWLWSHEEWRWVEVTRTARLGSLGHTRPFVPGTAATCRADACEVGLRSQLGVCPVPSLRSGLCPSPARGPGCRAAGGTGVPSPCTLWGRLAVTRGMPWSSDARALPARASRPAPHLRGSVFWGVVLAPREHQSPRRGAGADCQAPAHSF